MTGINIPREEGGVVTSSTIFKTIKRVIYEQSFTPTYIYIYFFFQVERQLKHLELIMIFTITVLSFLISILY